MITALLPVMGKLGDRYGFRRIHNLGYVIFTVGSILVAFSPNLPILLTLRVVQGIGAAMFKQRILRSSPSICRKRKEDMHSEF